jgi:biopolymer transport protein ExbD
MARPVNEINAGSMADIAFLLLIFFLVTTTMDVDTGITRKLPPPPPKDMEDIKVKERNIFKVLVSKSDRLLFNGKPGDISQLKDEAIAFLHSGSLANPNTPIDRP